MKKGITLLLTLVMLFCSPFNIFAESIENTEEKQETSTTFSNLNQGVSVAEPECEKNNNLVSTYGIQTPADVWDIGTNGEYDFNGSSNHKDLYTNYKFKGKSKYTVKVKNTGSKAIVVSALRWGKTYAMIRVGKGKTVKFNVTDIKKNTTFYLKFNGEGSSFSFSGYVK